MASLKDIAAELNISVGLVSKVLNDRMGTTGARARLRDRILKKARALGYVPNRVARALVTGRKGAIGIFINPWGERGTEFVREFLEGVEEGLQSTPYCVWLNFFRGDGEFYNRIDLRHFKQRADGLMIGGHPHPNLLPQLQKIERAGVPVVTFFEKPMAKSIMNVTVDYFRQGYLATAHLAGRGCNHIAHFHTGDIRLEGHLAALRDHDRPTNPGLIFKCANFSVADGRAATFRLLKSRKKFDGIAAQSDHQAFGACLELRDRGVGIPDEIRVIGVDDSPLCLASPIPMSSVTAECHQIGVNAAEAMVKKLAGQRVSSVVVSPRVVERSST